MKTEMKDTLLTESIGGEAGEFIKKATGFTFICLGTCWKRVKIDKLYGYEHDGGLVDSTGKKWWVFYHCKKCNYNTSFPKILRRMTGEICNE